MQPTKNRHCSQRRISLAYIKFLVPVVPIQRLVWLNQIQENHAIHRLQLQLLSVDILKSAVTP